MLTDDKIESIILSNGEVLDFDSVKRICREVEQAVKEEVWHWRRENLRDYVTECGNDGGFVWMGERSLAYRCKFCNRKIEAVYVSTSP